MADVDQIIAPPPGFTLRGTPVIPETIVPMPDTNLLPPGFTLRGVTPLPETDGMKELERRQTISGELDKAVDALPNPTEERAGLQNSYFYSHALDIPLSEANVLREEIAKELTGNESTTQKTFWNRLSETIKTGAKSGHSGLQAGLIQEQLNEKAFLLSLDALNGKWSQEKYNEIVELGQQIHALAPSEDTGFLNQVIWDVGQILPGMIKGMGEGALYGLGTAAAGAITGTVVPGVGTATMAGGGFLFGFTAGMASHSFRQMRGQSWLTLSQMEDEEGNPIPQSIVQLVSFTAGALNAAIEVGQMGTLIKTVPGASKILEKSVGNAFDEVIKDGTLRAKILQRMGEYGKYWITETGEEILQEIVDIVSEHVSMDLSNILTKKRGGRGGMRVVEEGTQFEHSTVMEDYRRLADTFIHSGPALAILGLPGNVMGGIQDIAAAQQQIEQQAEKGVQPLSEEDELLRTVSEGYRIETATPSSEERAAIIQKQSLEFVEPTPEIRQAMKESMLVELEGEKYTRKEVRKARDEVRETKVSELVEEIAELKTGTGKRAVGKAYTAGKETGLTQQKKATRESRLKALARKEQRERLNHIIADLKKVQSKIDVMSEEHTAPIHELIDGLDFTKHRESTMISLEKTRQYFENNPEVEISDGLKERLGMIGKRSIRDLSMDEVEDIYTAVMHHFHLEKRKQEIRIGLKHHKATLVISQAMNEMKPPKQIDTEIVSSKITPIEKAKAIGRKLKNFFGLRHNHYDLIIENLAGPNSTMDKVLFSGVKEGIIEQLRYRQETFKTFQKDLEKSGFARKDTDRWLNERVKVRKFDLTRNERMELYNHFLNEDNRESMITEGIGLKYGSDPNQVYMIKNSELMAIMNSLTPEERAFAGAPVRNLFEKQYDRLNHVFKEKNGYELPKEEIYFPKDVMPISRGTDIEKESALEQFKGQWTRVGLEKGMLERRRRVTKPIYIHGLTKVINKSAMNSSAYIGLELPLSDASRLLYNKNFRQQMLLRYGKETWGEIEKGLRDIAGEWRSYTDFEEALLKLRTRMSTAILGLDPFIMLKQVLSFAMGSTYVKPKYLLPGITDYMTDGKNVVARHKLYSPEYLERIEGGFSRDVQEVVKKTGGEKRLYGGKAKLPEKMMAGIKWFDKHTVTPIMQGAVLQVMDEFQSGKLSEEVRTALDIRPKDISRLTAEEKMQLAYKFADYVVNRTQPTFAAEHRSSLSRGVPVEKMITQFSSFTNQALNLLRRTLNDAKRTGSKAAVRRATKAFVSIMLVNTVGNALVNELKRLVLYNRRERKKQEGFAERMLYQSLKSVTGMFYVIRDLAQSAMSKIQRGTFVGYDVSIPVIRAANLFTDVVAHGFRMMSHPSKKQRHKEALQFIDTSIELTLILSGLPFSAPKKMIERVIEEIKD